MDSKGKPMTYEEHRRRTIEENKRRMEELGILSKVGALVKSSRPTPRKTPQRRSAVNLLCIETRRSTRAAGRPKIDYKEVGLHVGLRRLDTVGRPLRRALRRAYVSTAAKTEAVAKATQVKTTHPSFVKAMLKSHTSGGFWLGLPCHFCITHFTRDDLIILEDEDGMEWECVYLHNKHGLSGGWRGFSIDHELGDGDAVVFELVTTTRFKVFITRAEESAGASGGKTSSITEKNYQYVVKNSQNEHVHSEMHKALKRSRGEDVETPSRIVRRAKTGRGKGYDSSDESESEAESDTEDSESEEETVISESESESADIVTGEEDSAQELQEEQTPANEKSSRSPQRSENPKEKVKAKSKHTARGHSKPTTKATKRETKRAERAERKMDVPVVRKSAEGTRPKPVGVCSIARSSAKRKLPAIFPVRKYNFFTPKSVKVH